MGIERIMQFECKVCGRKMDVTRTGDIYEEPVFCCGMEATNVSAPSAPAVAAPRKPAKKAAKKKTAKKKAAKKPAKKKAAKKAVKKKAAKKAAKKPAKKKAAKKAKKKR